MTREDLGKLVGGLQLDGETYPPNMPESWCMDFPIADLRGVFSIHSEELSDIAPMRKLFGESVGETSFFDQILETFEEAAGQTGTALSDETDLGDTITEAVAQQFLDGNIDDLSEFTAIEDAAAESLSRHQGDLSLNGLTELSDAAVRVFAERLEENPFASWGGSKELHARFEELKALSGGRENSDSSEDEEEDGSDHANTITVAVAQEFLDGDIDDLGDFTAIDDDAAESLLEHQGELYLNGLTELSDAAARSLSGYGGHLGLPNLKMISRSYDGCLLLEAMVRRGGCINLSDLLNLIATKRFVSRSIAGE